MIYHEEKLLILTKTYPVPSSNYIENSCVVAINDNGQIRRLYPVPFRLMDPTQQFMKWQWIRANISRSSDRRPESHRIDVDSITLLGKISTKRNWDERLSWTEGHILENFSALDNRRLQTNQSLGFIRPRNIQLEITKSNHPDWTEKEFQNLSKQTLFDMQNPVQRAMLRKIPYEFHYVYECQTESNLEKNRHMVTDWEMGALYWNCQNKYGHNWEKQFRKKFEEDFNRKDLLFLMGNMHRFQDQWLIVGLVYPPHVGARQYPLLQYAPSE